MSNPQNQKQPPATASDGITPRAVDYGAVVSGHREAGGLADHSSVRGCMVIKPHGYTIWEKLQQNWMTGSRRRGT